MNDLVTIIVPVYKVEKYLPQCIESVINQTYKNLEIILVDDGSPDNCGKICDAYAEKDSRIFVIHKKNEGVSAARNDGIKASNGKYICFVDSDDYVLENYVEVLYKTIVEKNVDIVSCGFFRKVNNALLKKKKEQYADAIEYNSSQIFYDKLCIYFRAAVPWNKMFKSSIIKNNNVYFPVGIHPGEDNLFVIMYTKYIKSAAYISDAIYVYVDSDTSVCKSSEIKTFYKNDEREISVFNLILSDNNEPLYTNSVKFRKILILMHMIYDNKKYKLKNDIKKYKKELLNNWRFFVSYKISYRIKLRFILMIVSPFCFDVFRSLYRQILYRKNKENKCPSQ